jgi:NADH-quinone oxidoreductase subunit C
MMDESLFINRIKQRCGADITDSYQSMGMHTLEISNERIVPVCELLKTDEQLRFNYLSDICGVDYYPENPRFAVVYHLYSIPFKHRIRLKCRLDDGERLPSVTAVWGTANWHEREIFDMYGIAFSRHPDLRRIYMSDDFEGHPLRKDYPLRGYKDDLNPEGETGEKDGF